ncbi:hypothetical protein GUJ93_ZPchr0069g33261 [Zizania palustris]|uniref:Uncharacterized protein n=1 Tax=Zizania palustris TaxID=103762 RepID=A0A8J5RTE6_ZIZPA|nr:hypothetical protein GUJ93_ZPchr0069g33261 [Zizania palustris]KAG8044576.1 hypothetical protein GUJ93_ZPchr0069g33261 [Zizania palustris]KAG8044577.1 hypothetical protein GUJ93_ZPchr0069g33261 [Zizania palustris]
MVQLFFQGPTDGCSINTDAVKVRKSLLDKVESIIRSVIKSGGWYEARLWLCSTVSSIHLLDPYDQQHLFLDLLGMKNSKKDVAARLLRMIFDKKPQKAGSILAKNCQMLEEFFQGNPKRIMQWFGHFAVTGESTHKKGARALSQFAFVNRDICWEELEWKGKHGQSPAVVATKPHYFRDLDILQTVQNFLEYVPDFWSSEELADSIKDGEILQIDMEYFVDQYVRLMYQENSRDEWKLVEEFLMDEQFSSLCQHLLIHLDEQRLLDFLKALGKLINPNSQCKEMAFPCCWLEVLLSAHGDHISLDELVLLNCVIAKGRQLWRLMNDEEQEEEQGQMKELLKSINQLTDADHFTLMKGFIDMKFSDALKWIGIQSWVVFCELSKECKSADSCEHLFTSNRIEFRKADDYSLVQNDGNSIAPDSDVEDLNRSNHKRRKRDRKRRRRRYDPDEDNLDQLLEFGTSNRRGIESQHGSWYLSTDGFSSSWDIADIPDHLSSHYLRTWVKFACFR